MGTLQFDLSVKPTSDRALSTSGVSRTHGCVYLSATSAFNVWLLLYTAEKMDSFANACCKPLMRESAFGSMLF